ncbi:MAG: hypothetical protein J1F14_08525 [Treponema sp.]|nr:hypothetical protein [Treponema sp.]
MAEQISVIGTVILMMVVDFKKMAVEFRRHFGLASGQAFPALSIAENKLCEADGQFEFSIIPDSEWGHKDSVQAYYRHSESHHEIAIKESVYHKARGGDREALVSIAHEISHWGLINHFNLKLGVTEANVLDPVLESILIRIHENMADLLTTLFLFSEEELLNAHCAGDLDYGSCMSEGQISLALFYYKNHKVLAENFERNILPRIEAHQNKKEGNATKKLPSNWR